MGNLRTTRRQAASLAAAAAIAMLSGRASAAGGDPETTRLALGQLFAEASATLPDASSCQGHYGQHGKPKVKDLLAMSLAYLATGKNTIVGGCTATQCEITIKHAAGEDVSSARITFGLKRDRADIRTIQCVMTP